MCIRTMFLTLCAFRDTGFREGKENKRGHKQEKGKAGLLKSSKAHETQCARRKEDQEDQNELLPYYTEV